MYAEFFLGDIATVSDVAERMHISPQTLRKRFCREEGIPLSEFIETTRVDVMKEHLRFHNHSCKWICHTLGIREDSEARLFKRRTGETIQEYRERHRKNPPEQLPQNNLTKIISAPFNKKETENQDSSA